MTREITARAFAKKIINQEAFVILDVRNTDEFDKWKIEGPQVEIINEPYFNLLDGVDVIVNKFAKDMQIIVVCAKGGSSMMVGELLEATGFTDIYSLKDGMMAWSEHLEPVKIADLNGGGSLYQFVRLGKGCLSYFIESKGEAAVFDPARMIDVYIDFAKEKNVEIKHILDTHLHADHISGGRMLAEKSGGTYYLSEKDATELIFDYVSLDGLTEIIVGHSTVQVQPIYSPGHTIGSTSFIIDNKYLLTGDALFVESIGRPDLAGKAEDWVGDLRNTLYHKYRELSQDLIVLPAHYSFTKELALDGSVQAKLGDLYKENSSLQVEDEIEFRKMVTENLPAQPNAYEEIRHINMGILTSEVELQREMEVGPNRCAVHK